MHGGLSSCSMADLRERSGTVNPPDGTPSGRSPLKPIACTTGWSVILAARGDSEDAIRELATLVEHYRGFIRNCIGDRLRDYDPQNAEAALVHEEFPKLVRGAFPNGRKGRFRCLLRTAVNNHVISVLRGFTFALPKAEGEKQTYEKREVRDETLFETLRAAPTDEPDERLDTVFALEVMERALAVMRSKADPEWAAEGRLETLIFAPYDPKTGKPVADREQAGRFDLTPEALRQRRMRARITFRVFYAQEVSQTVEDQDLEDETRYLLGLVCQARCCPTFYT